MSFLLDERHLVGGQHLRQRRLGGLGLGGDGRFRVGIRHEALGVRCRHLKLVEGIGDLFLLRIAQLNQRSDLI